MYVRKSRQIGAILLVSGTTIGAGMLALPVLTGLAGFFPAVLLFIFYWLMSLMAAYFLLEVNLWFKEPVNLITMCKYTLGKKCSYLAWLVYLLLLYSLCAAYLSASGPMLNSFLTFMHLPSLDEKVATLPFLAIFGFFIFLGTRSVDYANRILMVGLVVAYFLLIMVTIDSVDSQLLKSFSMPMLILSVPVIVTSFGFHIVIPSLTNYLNKNVKVLKRVIFLGSFIPLLVYLVWEIVTVGTIAIEGPYGLLEAKELGQSATYSLAHILDKPSVILLSSLFTFFAIVTSFLGCGLSLSHFLKDGLKIHNSLKGRLVTLLMTLVPPILFVLLFPKGFILALDYAGIFVALLLGVLPALMVLYGRAHFGHDADYKVKGKTLLPLFVIVSYLIVIGAVFI